MKCQCPILAEDCLLALRIEGLLWRKPTLKLGESAAANDPIYILTPVLTDTGNS